MSAQRDRRLEMGGPNSDDENEESYNGGQRLFNRSPPAYGLNSSPSSGDSQASDDYDHSSPLPSPSSTSESLLTSFTLNESDRSSIVDVKFRHRFRHQSPIGSSSDEEKLSSPNPLPKHLSEDSIVQPQVKSDLHEIEQPETGNLNCLTLNQKSKHHLRQPLAHLNTQSRQNLKMKNHHSQKPPHFQVWSQQYQENVTET